MPPTDDASMREEPLAGRDFGAPYGERPEPEEFPMKTCKFYVSVLISGETEGDIQKIWDRVRKAIDSIEDIDDYDLEDSEMLDG
jgi:hypothetical protein